MSKETKKELIKAIKTAERLSNKLMGKEEHSHTKNGEKLYSIRQELQLSLTRCEYLEYKK